MSEQKAETLAARSIPGVMNRNQRFVQLEHAENAGAALKRIAAYFAAERYPVLSMLVVVILGTLCGVAAPSLQSHTIGRIAGIEAGRLGNIIALMLGAYLLYGGCTLLRGELFSKLMDLPIHYVDAHSNGDVMSRMINDVENFSTL